MKSILLTTTAIVAFAGAAVADGHTGVSFSGSTTLGYNDDGAQGNDGFYWDGNLAVSMATALDNGLTAGAEFDFDFVDVPNSTNDTLGQDLVSGGFVLSLTSENAGLYFGDTQFAAKTLWKSAGDMEADSFSEADGETVIRGDVSIAGVKASLSYVVADADGNLVGETTNEDVDQLSIGVAADFGMFSMTAGYQEESKFGGTGNSDFVADEVFGISVATSFSGADITVAYAERTSADAAKDGTSFGVKVAYPFGPVTATAYYVVEDTTTIDVEDNWGVKVAYSDGPIKAALDYQDDQGVIKVALDGSYNVGNGLTILAGLYDQSNDAGFKNGISNEGTDYYVAATYDLGGGAELLVSYADAETGGAIADDEVGGPDYQVGTTVALTFSF